MSLKTSATGVNIPKNKIAKMLCEITKPIASPMRIQKRYIGVMMRGNARSARLSAQEISAHRRGSCARSSGKSAIITKIPAHIVRNIRKSFVLIVGFVSCDFIVVPLV